MLYLQAQDIKLPQTSSNFKINRIRFVTIARQDSRPLGADGGGKGGSPGSRKEVAELGRKPQPEREGMLMMPAVVRRPYRDLMGDIMGGTRSGAAFLRRCLGTGSEASACKNTHHRLAQNNVVALFKQLVAGKPGEVAQVWRPLSRVFHRS